MLFIEFQKHGIRVHIAHRRNGNDPILLALQKAFLHHQMGDVTIPRVNHEFVDMTALSPSYDEHSPSASILRGVLSSASWGMGHCWLPDG